MGHQPPLPFKLQRGLHQGDPLSPFLFVMVVEALNLLITKATNASLWHGIKVCKKGPILTHLQYADDTILFCNPDLQALMNVKKTLILFQLSSGLQINFHKSAIMGVNIDDSWLEMAAQSLQCKVGHFPLTYLGLPIGGNSSRIQCWDPIIERMEKKLASWKGKLLSIGGRLTLIKASLSNLPMYYMSLFPLPHGVIEKITRLQRNFLWGSSVGKKPFPLVKWDLIKLPKIHGGLNVSSIFFRNLGLLAKWLWRYFVESDALWRKIIQIKYGYSPTLTMIDLKSPPKGGPWRHLCKSIFSNQKAALLLSQGTRKSIGDGSNSLFWHESWLHERNLKSQFPRLFRLSKLPNGLISEMGSWTNNSWQWALSWKRDLRARDLEEWASLKTLIQKVVLCQNSRDNLIWCPQKWGQFSVKSFYTELSKLTTPLAPSARRKIWRGLVPSRI